MSAGDLDGLYRGHKPRVLSVLRRLGVPDCMIEDAAHDVFVVLLRRVHEIDRSRGPAGWLSGVARRVALARRRGLVRARTAELAAVEPDRGMAAAELRVLAGEFLARVDGEPLAAWILADVEGCTAREIAERFAVPLSTAQWWLRTARARLRTVVAPRDRVAAWLPSGWLLQGAFAVALTLPLLPLEGVAHDSSRVIPWAPTIDDPPVGELDRSRRVPDETVGTRVTAVGLEAVAPSRRRGAARERTVVAVSDSAVAPEPPSAPRAPLLPEVEAVRAPPRRTSESLIEVRADFTPVLSDLAAGL